METSGEWLNRYQSLSERILKAFRANGSKRVSLKLFVNISSAGSGGVFRISSCHGVVAIAAHYGRIRVALERQGTPIGPNDLLIAAHCLASAITVVTGNDGEFRRVEGLRVENGLQPAE